MSYKKKLEFANYTCKFGEELNLLDLFEEVVWPSFSGREYIRTIKGCEYFFLDTFLLKLNDSDQKEPIISIAGKLVKNAKLKREQIYRVGQGIIEDRDELETAPTALFVLILNNHRLLYLKEVAGAPDIEAFRSTSQTFLNECHRKFIKRIHEASKVGEENPESARITKREMIEKYPFPELRVTTLTDPTSLETYIEQFERIEELTIKLLPTNNEDINMDGFWKSLSNTRFRMGSKYASTRFANKTDGLEKTEVYNQSETASRLANSDIKINGQDHDGGTLKGSNHDFQLTVELDDVSKNVPAASKTLYAEFERQRKRDGIRVPIISDATRDRILSIIEKLI